MPHLARANWKAVVKLTIPLNSIKFANNNYSTCFKKENAILINKLIPLKHYSTSAILLIDKNHSSDILDPVQYKCWTKVQVCSLLVTKKENGGAGLSLEKVKPLYHAGFDGTSLASIVSCIQEKDEFFAIEQLRKQYKETGINLSVEFTTTLSNVVHWVNTLLETRLFHLWSDEQVRKGLIEFVGFKIPIMRAQEFIGHVQKFDGDIPYQNNTANVLKVAKHLLSNIKHKKESANVKQQRLIINFAYYGFGKTRFGVQFLAMWSKYLKSNPDKKRELTTTFGLEAVDILSNTELIYVDMSQHAFSDVTFTYLNSIIPTNGSFFVVLDEYPAFCEKNYTKSGFETMYEVWNQCIVKIQNHPNVVGVYVCGKGAFIDMFGKSVFRDGKITHSPTTVNRVDLQSLTIDNMDSIFREVIPHVLADLEKVGLYDTFLKEVSEETVGIPLLVDTLVKSLKGKTLQSMEDIRKSFDALEILPKRILYPFSGMDFSCSVYTFLMFISQVCPKLDAKMEFDFTMFDFSQIEFLEKLERVDISTLAVALNCYVTADDDCNYVKLLFPRRTLKRYLHIGSSFSILPFVELIPQFINKGNAFETLIGSFIIWKAKGGAMNQSTFAEIFPFFTHTPLENEMCVDIKAEQTNKKLLRDNASTYWDFVHFHFLDYQNKMCFMSEYSFGPEKFIVLKQDLWWCIQDRNTTEFSFTKLVEEIENLKVFPTSVRIIFTIFYRCSVDLNVKVYGGGSIIHRPMVYTCKKSKIKKITIPKNVVVVIVDKTGVEAVIGSSNYKVLVELSKVGPVVPSIIDC